MERWTRMVHDLGWLGLDHEESVRLANYAAAYGAYRGWGLKWNRPDNRWDIRLRE